MEINQYDSGSMHDSAGKEEEEEKSSSESSECDESRLEKPITEMEIILKQKEQVMEELKVIREKKEELETENSSLKEKLKFMKAEKKRFEKRAELYQKKAEDVKKMKEEMVTLEEKNDDLEDFKRHCLAILTGENISNETVHKFIDKAGGGKDKLQLHVAVSLGLGRIVRETLKGHKELQRQKNGRGWTPLQLAAARGDRSILHELWKTEAVKNLQPPLVHLATANEHKSVIKFLKDYNIDMKERHNKVKAVHLAEKLNNKKLAEEINPWKINIFKRRSTFPIFHGGKRQLLEATPKVEDEYIKELLLFGGKKDLDPPRKRARYDPETDQQTEATPVQEDEEEERDGSVSEAESSSDEEQEPRPQDIHHHQHQQHQDRQPQYHNQQPIRHWGLPNLGNTCYMNSVLQCLCRIEPLASKLRMMQGDGSQGEVVRAMGKVCESLRTGEELKKNVKYMKAVAAARDETFRDYEQKEAHDFLARVLEWLHADAVTAATKNGATDGVDVDYFGGGNRDSFVSKLFRIGQNTTIACHEDDNRPHFLSQNYEPAFNLSLPVPRDGHDTLKGLLDKYFEAHWVRWDCDKCRTEHPCEHKIIISRLPSVLVLHLSRASDLATSNDKMKIQYPLNGLIVDYTTHGLSRSYNLAAVCCHDGGMQGGHYSAYCRVGKQWYYFNDKIVQPVGRSELLSRPSAHILFYEADETAL